MRPHIVGIANFVGYLRKEVLHVYKVLCSIFGTVASPLGVFLRVDENQRVHCLRVQACTDQQENK